MTSTTKKNSSPWQEKLESLDLWFLALVTFLSVLLVLLFTGFIVVMLSDMDGQSIREPIKYIKALFHDDKRELLTFLGLSMGGVLLALQAVIANRRAKAMEKAAEAQAAAAEAQAAAAEAQAAAAGAQVKANDNTEMEQRQERLKNAIEHLGSPAVSVRLGGVYELFHLADDIEEWSQTILDILCAHIRQTTSEMKYKEDNKSKPSEEIQSLLTLLFVRKHEVFKDRHINLQASWLIGAQLPEARLQAADLDDVHLQGANLISAQLQSADLSGARLQAANLLGAKLMAADLPEAQLQKAELYKARLLEAQLPGANLQGANLSNARLQGADLSMAQLQGAQLPNVWMHGAELYMTQLQGAWLDEVQFHEALFDRTQLQGTTSKYALSHWDSFKERMIRQAGHDSDLSGVIFAGDLEKEDVESIVEGLSARKASILRSKLFESHVDEKVSHEPPINGENVNISSYSQNDAERWIADYEAAMSVVSKMDNS